MRRPLAAVVAVAFAASALAACGGDDSPLAQTEKNMAALKAATIDLRLAASSGSGETATGPVGFQLEGPFEFTNEHDLAVFNLTYTRLLGGDESVTKVRSTGDEVFVTVGGKTYPVDDSDVASLRVSDDAPDGFSDLGISGWVRDPKVKPGGSANGVATDVITGEVNVPDMLSDLARVAKSLDNESGLTALGGDSADRLQKLVRSSSIRVVTTAKTRQLRSLRAVVDFGTRAPQELRRTLGKYAQARLEVELSLQKAKL